MMNSAIAQLEEALQRQDPICTSPEILTTFPPILFHPFITNGIGIIVCLRGHFHFCVEGEIYCAEPQQTVFLPTDKAFQITDHSDDLQVQLLLYQVEPIRDILGTTVTSMHIYTKVYPHQNQAYPTGQEEDLVNYISLINHTCQHNNGAYNDYEQKLLLLSLTYRLCGIFQHKMQKTQPANARRTEVFLQLISLIDLYYQRERGVEFYADKLCLSPKYLSELTKSICGYTVQELVFKAIIRESKTLLTTTSKTIQEISNTFHFPNASSFGTFFKKQIGTSPQKYRESEDLKEKRPQEED